MRRAKFYKWSSPILHSRKGGTTCLQPSCHNIICRQEIHRMSWYYWRKIIPDILSVRWEGNFTFFKGKLRGNLFNKKTVLLLFNGSLRTSGSETTIEKITLNQFVIECLVLMNFCSVTSRLPSKRCGRLKITGSFLTGVPPNNIYSTAISIVAERQRTCLLGGGSWMEHFPLWLVLVRSCWCSTHLNRTGNGKHHRRFLLWQCLHQGFWRICRHSRLHS